MHDFSEVRRLGLGFRFLLQMHDFSEVSRVGLGLGFFYKCSTSPKSLGVGWGFLQMFDLSEVIRFSNTPICDIFIFGGEVYAYGYFLHW